MKAKNRSKEVHTAQVIPHEYQDSKDLGRFPVTFQSVDSVKEEQDSHTKAMKKVVKYLSKHS
jgi:hypothetical protein